MLRKYILLPFFAALLLVSCQDEVFDPVIKIGNPPVISEPAANASFILTEDAVNDVMTKFAWSVVNYGFSAAVTYEVQMDLAGNAFADLVSLGSVNILSLEVTEGKMNGILLSKGLPGNVAANLEIRVAATVNPDVAPVYSEPITISVTPFESAIEYPKLYVPGSYQGWDPAKEETVIYSLKSDRKYEGYVYIPDADALHKYTDGPSWDINYGDDGNDGTLEEGGADIPLGAAGVYRLNADLNALTHSSVRTDWGLIGDATPGGWDADQDMTYDPATGIWSVTLDLNTGEMKFRANDDWGINFGDNDTNKSLEYDGANIPVAEAGNYTVELILNQAQYTYELTKN